MLLESTALHSNGANTVPATDGGGGGGAAAAAAAGAGGVVIVVVVVAAPAARAAVVVAAASDAVGAGGAAWTEQDPSSYTFSTWSKRRSFVWLGSMCVYLYAYV